MSKEAVLDEVLSIEYYTPTDTMSVLELARCGGWNSAIDYVRKVIEDAGSG